MSAAAPGYTKRAARGRLLAAIKNLFCAQAVMSYAATSSRFCVSLFELGTGAIVIR
jgi:hypothetical protein